MNFLAELPACPVPINTNTISTACERGIGLLAGRGPVVVVKATYLKSRGLRIHSGLEKQNFRSHSLVKNHMYIYVA